MGCGGKCDCEASRLHSVCYSVNKWWQCICDEGTAVDLEIKLYVDSPSLIAKPNTA